MRVPVAGCARLGLALAVFACAGWPSRVSALQVGDILVSGSSGIVRVDPATGDVSTFSPFAGVAAADAGRGVFAADGDSVVSLDPVSGAPTVISSGGLLTGLVDIELGPSGSLIVAAAGGVIRVDSATGAQTFLSDGAGLTRWTPYKIAIGTDGQIYALGGRFPDQDPPASARVVRIDPISRATSFVGIAQIGSTSSAPGTWAAGPDGRLYWSEAAASGLRAMDPATGEIAFVGAALDYTIQTELAVGSNGDLITLGFILEPYGGGPTRWAIGRTRLGPGATYATSAVSDPFPSGAVGPLTVVVPEPSGFTLGAAGLACFATARRSLRRARASA